jgi:hypothetical protein
MFAGSEEARRGYTKLCALRGLFGANVLITFYREQAIKEEEKKQLPQQVLWPETKEKMKLGQCNDYTRGLVTPCIWIKTKPYKLIVQRP